MVDSGVDALTLDMSDAGAATFNAGASIWWRYIS